MLCPKPIDLCVKLLFVTDLGLRYTIFVKFNSSGKIEHIGNELTISLKSKPERNKANRELLSQVSYLMSLFHIPNVLFRYSDTAVFCSSICS